MESDSGTKKTTAMSAHAKPPVNERFNDSFFIRKSISSEVVAGSDQEQIIQNVDAISNNTSNSFIPGSHCSAPSVATLKNDTTIDHLKKNSFWKKSLRNSFPLAIAIVIANLFLLQNNFGQAGPVRLIGSGGTITEINVSGTFYKVHTYTATGSSTFTPPSGASNVEYLVVAGGGGGGRSVDRTGGGGGAGGVLTSSSFGVTVQSYPVTVGAGGATNAAGGNSVFSTFTAIGGGRGGQQNSTALSGGSGGGGYHSNSDAGKAGTAGQGNNGGSGYDSGNGTNGSFAGGGGGGQSQAGGNGVNTGSLNSNAGKGGDGFTSLISGSSIIYAGGGGGGFQHLGTSSGNAGAGGTGGGGAGGSGGGTGSTGVAGTANRGGGGGGAGGGTNVAGGAGGSGIVIVRYKAPTIAINIQAPSTVLSGSNFSQPLVIQILNGDGAAVSGVVVTTAIESGAGASLTNVTATTDASGNATFTNLHISGPSGNSYTLNFIVPGSTVKVVSNSISLCTTPTTTYAKNDVQCFNTNTGQIVITASNGTSPFTYSLDNGANYSSPVPTGTFNNLPVGTYKIRVKDANGCESRSVQ